jgi:hypothetical protein
MKRLIGFSSSLILVLALVICLAAPAFASGGPGVAGSQTWYLDDRTINDAWGNTMTQMTTDRTGVDGSVAIPALNNPQQAPNSKIWIANKIALANVMYPNDSWAIRIATDGDWTAKFVIDMGYWAQDGFHVLVTNDSPLWYYDGFINQFKGIISKSKPGECQQFLIPKGTYLAVRIWNNNGVEHTVYTGDHGDAKYFSCVTSPQTDPGYPTPEMATGLLLGAGVLSLGGFMILRRKQSGVKA